MYKIIDINPYVSDTDELSVKWIDINSFSKTASVLSSHVPEEIVSFVKGISNDPTLVYAHIIALSTDEKWGSNRNGDTFREKDILETQDDVEAAKNPEPYTNIKLPRYKTFLSAKLYKHHQNKPDSVSYGDVVCAAYNMKMHRVEIVIRISKVREPELAAEIESGMPIAFSMGCKIPWDSCSICQHVAKSRADYCVHAKTMMGKILDDGRQVKVYNPKPRFFDISRVCQPADETAFLLKKVASLVSSVNYSPLENDEADDDFDVLASAFKRAEISKKIKGVTIGDAVKNVNLDLMKKLDEPDFSNEDLERSSNHPLQDILSTLTGMGMVMKPQEHRKIIIIKISKSPDFLQKEGSAIDVDYRNNSIYNIFKKYAESRSCYTDHLVKRASVLSNNENEVETDPICEALYNIYRRELNNLDAQKVASAVERTYNLEGLFKSAVHWTVPTAAVPLAAAYMYGAHQDYKRRYLGTPTSGFEDYMAEHPGSVGVGGALGAVALRGLLKGKKIAIMPK